MTNFASKTGAQNWNDGNAWTGGSGADYPGSAGTGDTVSLIDGTIMALNVSPANSMDSISVPAAGTGYITVSASRTISLTGATGVTNAGTTAGVFRVSAGVLTLTCACSTAALRNTSSGNLVVTSSTGGLTITNGSAVAVQSDSTGVGISHAGSGVLSITGKVLSTGANAAIVSGAGNWSITNTGGIAIQATGSAYAFRNTAGVGTVTGDVLQQGTSISGAWLNSSTATLVGLPLCSGVLQPAISLAAGTLTWGCTETIDFGEYAYISSQNVLVISSLNITNNGQFVLVKTAGSTLTVGAGATLANITNSRKSAQAAFIGYDASAIVHSNYPRRRGAMR